MTAASVTGSAQHIVENLVRGQYGLATGVGSPITHKAVKGIHVVSATIDLASQTAATGSVQEFVATADGDEFTIAVGDICIPIFPTAGVSTGVVFGPCQARTAHKVAIQSANVTVGNLNEASQTIYFLIIDIT